MLIKKIITKILLLNFNLGLNMISKGKNFKFWLFLLISYFCIITFVFIYKNSNKYITKDYMDDDYIIKFKEKKRKLNDLGFNETKLFDLKRKNPNSILFLKTFKTGSSSFANLLHNYIIRNNKSGIVNTDTFYRFNKKSEQTKILNRIISWNGEKHPNFEVFVDHAIFDPFMYKIVQNSYNQILTIFRHPVNRFISSWNHCLGRNHFIKNKNINNISQFLQTALLDENFRKRATFTHPRWSLNSVCQQIVPDMLKNGVDKFNNIEKIRNGQWLVLILERFDESLLVLKYAYNLTWEDLVYMKMKSNKGKKNDESINEDEKKILEELNKCDLKLYKIAYKVFDLRLNEIYKGNKTAIENDIKLMNKIIREEIEKCKDQKIGEKSLYCKSMKLDHAEWNSWATMLLKVKRIF